MGIVGDVPGGRDGKGEARETRLRLNAVFMAGNGRLRKRTYGWGAKLEDKLSRGNLHN